MNNQDAIDSFRKMRNEEVLCVNFISPLLSGILSSSRIILRRRPTIIYQGATKSYASNSGLESALDQRYHEMIRTRSSTEGITWSHLTTLFNHDEINGCNTTIINLLFSQLGSVLDRKMIDEIAKVVGELHDNVASHSGGRGFSALIPPRRHGGGWVRREDEEKDRQDS